MPNTTNYLFPTPADTDLVKNGADAIRDLGDAVDTAMNTALGTKKAGMVLLNTTSFSGVSSQAVTPVFSSTYQNYLVTLTLSGTSADSVVYLKLRSGATDNSTGYSWAYVGFNTSSADTNTGLTGQTLGFVMCSLEADFNKAYYSSTANIYRPFEATITSMSAIHTGSTTAAIPMTRSGGGWHTVESPFDGFNLVTTTGNITGTVRTYGYN
jgi:hypothetical protein